MLNTEALQLLTDEEKGRLVEFERTFSTKGWEFIKEWAEKSAAEQDERMKYAANWEQFQALRTSYALFLSFANLEEETYKEFERIGFGRVEVEQVDTELEHE